MSCAACVAHVEKAVRRVLNENDRFTVSLLTNSVSILLFEDINRTEQEKLEAALSASVAAAGYELLLSPGSTLPPTNSQSSPRALWAGRWQIRK